MDSMTEIELEEELLGTEQDRETTAYKEAFDHFDWNHSGSIPTTVRPLKIGAHSNLFVPL